MMQKEEYIEILGEEWLKNQNLELVERVDGEYHLVDEEGHAYSLSVLIIPPVPEYREYICHECGPVDDYDVFEKYRMLCLEDNIRNRANSKLRGEIG